jgi:hypothetical protein
LCKISFRLTELDETRRDYNGGSQTDWCFSYDEGYRELHPCFSRLYTSVPNEDKARMSISQSEAEKVEVCEGRQALLLQTLADMLLLLSQICNLFQIDE